MIPPVLLATWLSIAATRPISSADVQPTDAYAPPTARDAALVQSFLTNDDRRVRCEAAWSLGDSQLPGMNPVLARCLTRETNEWVRADLLHAMGRLEGPRDTVAVLTGLSDADPAVRSWALWTLGRWQAVATMQSVARRAIQDPSESVRAETVITLEKLDPAGVEPVLVAALRDVSPRVRMEAATTMGKFLDHDENAIHALLAAGKDSDPLVRAAAIGSMGMVTNPPVADFVAGMAGDDFPFVRKQVAASLRRLGASNHVPTAIELLADVDMSVRMEAAAALASFGSKTAIEPLIGRFDDRDKFVRRAAARALVDLKMPDEIVPRLILQLNHPSTSVRAEAAWALGEYRDRRGTIPLIKTVTDADVGTSLNGIEALGKMADPLGLETLIEQLKQQSAAKRAMAAWSLGELRDKRATQALISILTDPVFEPRLEAATAAGKIRDEGFVKPLLVVLQNVTTEQFTTRAAAAWSLGEIGDTSAVPRLEQMISEKVVPMRMSIVYDDDTVRMNSTIAVTRIAMVAFHDGRQSAIAAFLEAYFDRCEMCSDNFRECFAECLFELTGRKHEFIPAPLPSRQYFIRSVETDN